MGKQALYVLLAIWIIIAVFLTGLLVHFLSGGAASAERGWNVFPFSFSLSGFSISSGPLEEQSRDSFESSAVAKITVDCTAADVKLIRSQDEKINVTVSTSESSKNLAATVKLDGDVIRVSQRAQNISIIGYRQLVEIALPEDWKKDLEFSVTTGDFELSGDYVFGGAVFKGTTGDFSASSLSADSLSIVGTTGDIDIDALDCADYKLTRTTGDITVDASSGSGSVDTTTGDIVWNVTRLDGGLDVTATTGDIELYFGSQVGADVSASTSVGDIDSDYSLSSSGKRSVGDQVSGKIGGEPYHSVNVSTSVGDIDLEKAG